MTEQITLKFTFEELEQIDKYIELNDDTRQLFDKIRSAYPKSPVEAANKAALESLGIDYESFGQKPWNEGDLDYEAPNGDYIKNYPLINRVEVIGKNGREYVQYDCSNVQVSEQDEGRTLKVFLS